MPGLPVGGLAAQPNNQLIVVAWSVDYQIPVACPGVLLIPVVWLAAQTRSCLIEVVQLLAVL